jgi:hypothetical protein
MIKHVKRSTPRAASQAILAERVVYISNPSHPDHSGKTIHPARNHNCSEQSPEGFIAETIRLDDQYRKSREGKRGKRSRRLFEEVVYSSPHAANLTSLERESVEAMIINLIGRTTTCRTAWHVDEATGRADLHVLLGAKNSDYPPKVTLWADFGGKSGRHIFAEFDRIDQRITQQLNRAPERVPKLKSANDVHQEQVGKVIGNKLTLAAEIAAQTQNPITSDNIAETIKALGHSVTRLTAHTVSVVFRGRQKARRFNLDVLLGDVEVRQLSLKEKELDASSFDGPRLA